MRGCLECQYVELSSSAFPCNDCKHINDKTDMDYFTHAEVDTYEVKKPEKKRGGIR